MDLKQIQSEQADTLRQEKIINDFLKAHPHLRPKVKTQKTRDLISEAERVLSSRQECNSTGTVS